MYDSALDVVFEVLILLAEVLATGVAIALGLSAEMASISNFGVGNTVLGLWFAYMGTLALFVGVYLLGYRKVAKRLVRTSSPQ